MRTTADRLERLQQVLGELHSYDTPEWLCCRDAFAGLWTLGVGGSQLR